MRAKTLAKKIANFTLSKKASNVLIMDLRKITDITDYFVLCSADSDVQVKAITDAVLDGTEKLGIKAWRTEGLSQRQWVILDYIDVVVHIFLKEVRKYYNIEKLWGDAKIETVEDKLPVVKKQTKKKSERVSKK
ncbi:MAG: Iojap protein [Ignavibacteriae bacterium]|nr:MAG: Iojap protein [Ignavibacteriota bacterium]